MRVLQNWSFGLTSCPPTAIYYATRTRRDQDAINASSSLEFWPCGRVPRLAMTTGPVCIDDVVSSMTSACLVGDVIAMPKQHARTCAGTPSRLSVGDSHMACMYST